MHILLFWDDWLFEDEDEMLFSFTLFRWKIKRCKIKWILQCNTIHKKISYVYTRWKKQDNNVSFTSSLPSSFFVIDVAFLLFFFGVACIASSSYHDDDQATYHTETDKQSVSMRACLWTKCIQTRHRVWCFCKKNGRKCAYFCVVNLILDGRFVLWMQKRWKNSVWLLTAIFPTIHPSKKMCK